MAIKDPDPKTDVNYAALGQAVERALVQDYVYLLHSTRRQIWSSFIRGMFAGLGSVIGATIVVAALLAVLQFLGGAPVIGQFIKDIGDVIQNK